MFHLIDCSFKTALNIVKVLTSATAVLKSAVIAADYRRVSTVDRPRTNRAYLFKLKKKDDFHF